MEVTDSTSQKLVSDIMNIGVHTCSISSSVAQIAILFILHQSARGLEYPEAVIKEKHFIRDMADEAFDDSQDIGVRTERHSPLQSFYSRRDEARRLNLRNSKP